MFDILFETLRPIRRIAASLVAAAVKRVHNAVDDVDAYYTEVEVRVVEGAPMVQEVHVQLWTDEGHAASDERAANSHMAPRCTSLLQLLVAAIEVPANSSESAEARAVEEAGLCVACPAPEAPNPSAATAWSAMRKLVFSRSHVEVQRSCEPALTSGETASQTMAELPTGADLPKTYDLQYELTTLMSLAVDLPSWLQRTVGDTTTRQSKDVVRAHVLLLLDAAMFSLILQRIGANASVWPRSNPAFVPEARLQRAWSDMRSEVLSQQ